MITLKTTDKKTFLEPAGVHRPITDYLYLKIDRPEFLTDTSVTVVGYYYYLVEGEPVKLRDIQKSSLDKSEIHGMQGTLIPNLDSEKFFDLMHHLMFHLAVLTLQQEAAETPGTNYGITGTDVELYNPNEE